MAEHAGSEPLLVGLVVAAAMSQSAFSTLEVVLASGDLSEDDLSLLNISDTFSFQRLLDRAFSMEEAFAIATFCDYGATFRMTELDGGAPSPCEEELLGPFYRIFIFEDDLDSYREILKEFRRHAQKPYYEATSEWPANEETPEDSARGLITQYMIPATGSAAVHIAAGDARWGIARLAVATARYRVAENQLPRSVDDLVPQWLPAVPLDPFDGKPLRMKRAEHEVILYSVGPDKVDDSGAMYDASERTGDITFAISKPFGKSGKSLPGGRDAGDGS